MQKKRVISVRLETGEPEGAGTKTSGFQLPRRSGAVKRDSEGCPEPTAEAE